MSAAVTPSLSFRKRMSDNVLILFPLFVAIAFGLALTFNFVQRERDAEAFAKLCASVGSTPAPHGDRYCVGADGILRVPPAER